MKGTAYRCAVCRKEDYRGRIVRHYLREHVPEKNIPYHCKLCSYVSEDRIQWDKHVKLKEHTEALKELDSEVEVEPRSFLIEAREKFQRAWMRRPAYISWTRKPLRKSGRKSKRRVLPTRKTAVGKIPRKIRGKGLLERRIPQRK